MELYKTKDGKGILAECIYLKNGNNLEKIHNVEERKTLIQGITYKKSAKFVEVFFSISSADITVPNGWTGITCATLPVGYRPNGNIVKNIYCRKKDSISTLIPINLSIQSDGNIRFVNLTGAEINFEYLVDYILFPVS